MSPHAATITLCVAAAAGVLLIGLADRLRIPYIALLLVGGIVLGPEGLGLVDPRSLGAGLETVVALAVAVILFEGGLTLDVAGFRREPKVIVRMLTFGVLVTWVGTAAIVYLVYDQLGIELSIITGSLVIVTGPTVISPILRRIGVQPRLHHVLYWEGVLVDAVGVFIAVLCYEWIASSADQPLLAPLGRFASRFVVGAGIGAAVGLVFGFTMRRGWITADHANISALAAALLALGAANAVLAESGILAVIVAGLVVSLQRIPQLKVLKRFKLELTEVGIGLLFVLLSAQLELENFVRDARLLLVLALVLFLIRPLNVLVSTWGRHFGWREKAFLSWLAPRGIVAASMASLLSLRLENLGYENASYLETITYAVIGTTVLLQGLSAPVVARALGLRRPERGTWLLIGDPTLAVLLHRQLRQAGGPSLVMEAGPREASDLVGAGVDAIASDPLAPPSIRDPRVAEVEAVVAVALDPDLNRRICEAWSGVVGWQSCYRWDTGGGDEPGSGVSPWEDIGVPGDIVAGLEAGRCEIEALEIGPPEDARRFGPNLRPLLAVEEGRISVVAGGEVPPDAESVITLRRRIPGLYGLVRDATILDRARAGFEEVVRSLLSMAADDTPGLAADAHLREILEREQTMPTTIGGGVALPHVYDHRVARSTCYVANIVGGLDLAGPDDEPVRLVFLVLSPPGQAPEHLRSLAAVAELANDSRLLDVLAHQRTRGRLLSLLRERE